jgi:ABC-type multidrug transport system permease subunit
MRWHAFTQLLLARLREFYREPEALFWVYGFPLLLAVGLGIAFASREPQPPDVDVQGTPQQTDAIALVQYLKDKGIPAEIHSARECEERLSNGKTALYLVPTAQGPRFEYDPARSESVMALHWVDALLVRKAASTTPRTSMSAWWSWVDARLVRKAASTVPTLDAHKVEQAGSRYIDFLVPGLMGLNLMGGGLWGVGFVIVDMRVRKLLKRLLATPIRREDFLLAILSARLVFLTPDMALLLLVGCVGFGVPVRGSWLTLVVVILVGAAAFAGIGLLVACRAQKTETITGLMNAVMLPMWLLSGTFFSSERFPDAMQPLIQALPLTQLNNALREVMLNERSLTEVAWRLGILAVWGAGSFVLALRWFRWR